MAKEENTPVLLEIQTYRYRGHSIVTLQNIEQEELDEYRNQDPI